MHRKRTLIIILSILFTAMSYSQGIQEYTWKKRVLLLVDKTMVSRNLQAQYDLFKAKSAELEERAMLIFLVTPTEVQQFDGQPSALVSSEIYKSLSIPAAFQGVLLIGKDGGVKLQKPFQVRATDIFELIDGMPMRKSEINRRKSN